MQTLLTFVVAALLGIVVSLAYAYRAVYNMVQMLAPPQVLVNGKSKELYHELELQGGPNGMMLEKLARGAAFYIDKRFDALSSNSKVLSVKPYGQPHMPALGIYGVLYQVHVQAEFELERKDTTEKVKVFCNFLIDPTNKAAELIWIGPS